MDTFFCAGFIRIIALLNGRALGFTLPDGGEPVTAEWCTGKVGMTGTATGPHLHYQFWVNGAYVDPMKQKHARTERLPKGEMAAFTEHTQALQARLDAD